MYILILDDVPDEFAPVIAAHASLACYRKFTFRQDLRMSEWIDQSFKKVVCRVSQKEYDKAKEADDFVELSESALEGRVVALAFCPREEWPKGFKFFKMWRPDGSNN